MVFAPVYYQLLENGPERQNTRQDALDKRRCYQRCYQNRPLHCAFPPRKTGRLHGVGALHGVLGLPGVRLPWVRPHARVLRSNSPPWKDPLMRARATRAYDSRNSRPYRRKRSGDSYGQRIAMRSASAMGSPPLPFSGPRHYFASSGSNRWAGRR